MLDPLEKFILKRVNSLNLNRDTRKKVEFVMAIIRTVSNLLTVFISLVSLVIGYLTFTRVWK